MPGAKEDVCDVQVSLHLPENKSVKGVLELIRVHVFASSFVPENPNELALRLKDNRVEPQRHTTRFGQKKSVFLVNKQLGDEYCYILARRDQSAFVGNTLERPQVLLKRTEVRETSFE